MGEDSRKNSQKDVYRETSSYFSIYYNKAIKSDVLAFRNGKGRLLSWKKLEKKISQKKQKDFLLEKIRKKSPDIIDKRFKRTILAEKEKKRKKAKTFYIQSSLKYFLQILMVRKGDTPKILLTIGDFALKESDMSIREAYAIIDEEVKFRIGNNLKHYLILRLFNKVYRVNGGLRLKKFKVYKNGDKELFYDKEISFVDL